MASLQEQFYFHNAAYREGEIPVNAISCVRINESSLIVNTVMGFESGIQTDDRATKFEEIQKALAADGYQTLAISGTGSQSAQRQLAVLKHARAVVVDAEWIPLTPSARIEVFLKAAAPVKGGFTDIKNARESLPGFMALNTKADPILSIALDSISKNLYVRVGDIKRVLVQQKGFQLQFAEGKTDLFLSTPKQIAKIIGDLRVHKPDLPVENQPALKAREPA